MIEHAYIHIPFCLKKCLYCDFLSFKAEEAERKEYLRALNEELEEKLNQGAKLEDSDKEELVKHIKNFKENVFKI